MNTWLDTFTACVEHEMAYSGMSEAEAFHELKKMPVNVLSLSETSQIMDTFRATKDKKIAGRAINRVLSSWRMWCNER